MSFANMQLEGMLAILGRCGTVTLRKGTNDVSATPGHKANVGGWVCEITLKGYLSPYGHGAGGSQVAIGRWDSPAGMSATQAAAHTLTQLETFLDGPEGKRCRDCYMRDHESKIARVGTKNWDNSGRPHTHPGQPPPEIKINYGD